MDFSQFTSKETKEVLKILKTQETGLSKKEAQNRQKIYGFNEIKVKKEGLFDIFLRQFKSPFFYLLFIAAFLAFLIGEQVNGLIILGFVFINVFLGFFQEARAAKTASILKKYIPLKARVLREGKQEVIEQEFLVPGDIVLLQAGNIIPADLRILKTENILVDEEVLTGESVPVVKTSQCLLKETNQVFEAKNILFTASTIVSGVTKGVVIGTGKKTVFGEIAKLTAEAKKESTYEKNILNFSRLILRIVVTSIILVFVANLFIKGITGFFDFLIFCLALIVSIIPEALPAVVTFALSQGSLALAKSKVVVKRLSAIEDLGDIEILCTDKTGTITEGTLSLKTIFSSNQEKCLLYGLLSADKNPFDAALFEKTSSALKKKLSYFKKIAEIPFDNNRMRNSVLMKDKKESRVLIVKGAPEVILKLSLKFGKKFKFSQVKQAIQQEGRQGRRTLAVAFKKFNQDQYSQRDEDQLTFLGFYSFVDPLKKTTLAAIKLADKLGVQIKILTGDSPQVAGAVGKEIGLVENNNQVILGESLETLSYQAFAQACEDYHIFARISPQMKFKIVETLQKKFEVGFLGEGINDAPSLKIANVAIAVKEGADISREVSDIILLRKDLRVIVEGIKKGRNIFSNINKYIKCTLASNFGNFYSIALVSLFIPFLPMLPIQILLVNLLSDFPLITIATDQVDVEELKKPKSYQLNQVIGLIVQLALVSTIFDFIFFGLFHQALPSLLQTLWFVQSILTEILLIYSVRTRRFFLKTKRPGWSLIFFSLLAIFITLALPFSHFGQNFFLLTLPPTPALFTVLLLILIYLLVSEAVKLSYFRAKTEN